MIDLPEMLELLEDLEYGGATEATEKRDRLAELVIRSRLPVAYSELLQTCQRLLDAVKTGGPGDGLTPPVSPPAGVAWPSSAPLVSGGDP